ncbi:MAG: dihydrodipicolinate synthase family protein [Acidobacteriota bacterium]
MGVTLRRDGIFAALWTPTDADGRLLESELAALVEFLRNRRIHGVFALGSTGQFLYLEPEARKRLVDCVVQQAGPLPVVANISDIRPAVVADLGRSARASGCAAVAIMPPYFYEPPQVDLVEFFVQSGEAAGLPVLLYNFPERTGARIELETIAQVADRIPLAGIKHSGADAAYLPALIGLGREKNFVVFSGADTQIAEGMALGTAGCVGGLANIVPDLMVQIFDAARAGFPERATRAADRVRQLGEMIDRLHFPLNVAAGMEARNLPVGQPKAICSAATLEAYRRLVADVRNLLRQWNLVE